MHSWRNTPERGHCQIRQDKEIGWLGSVEGMSHKRLAKQLLSGNFDNRERKKRPRRLWIQEVEVDFEDIGRRLEASNRGIHAFR